MFLFSIPVQETEYFRQHDGHHGEICDQPGGAGGWKDGPTKRGEEAHRGASASDATKVRGKKKTKIYRLLHIPTRFAVGLSMDYEI